MVVVGFEDPALSLRGEGLLLPPLLFSSTVNCTFFPLKFTLKPECTRSPELFRFRPTQTHTQTGVSRVSRVFRANLSAWDSNQRLTVIAAKLTNYTTHWGEQGTNIVSDDHNFCCIAVHNKLNPSLQSANQCTDAAPAQCPIVVGSAFEP